MIISLRFKNFFSLRDDAGLDFTADLSSRKYGESLPENLLDFKGDKFINIIGLFGGNATGKSNLMKAMAFCRRLVLDSHLYNEDSRFDFEPFKFQAAAPSEMSIDFVTEGIEYEYSFKLFGGEVLEESLYYYPKGRRAKVFVRTEGNQYSFGKGIIARPAEIEANTGTRTLFLSRASSMNRPVASQVYRFFLEKIVIGIPEEDGWGLHPEMLEENLPMLLKAFEISDSDIIDIRLGESASGKPQLMSFHREDPSLPFDFDKEESEGTKRLLKILLILLKKANEGATFFLDEFDLRLHQRLAEFLLDIIRATKGGQLVFTSHNPALIDSKKLRLEQIVVVSKDSSGGSEFVPLSDYEGLSPEADIRKGYLQGRFDGIPYIGVVSDIFVKYGKENS